MRKLIHLKLANRTVTRCGLDSYQARWSPYWQLADCPHCLSDLAGEQYRQTPLTRRRVGSILERKGEADASKRTDH